MKKTAVTTLVSCVILAGCGAQGAQSKTVITNEIQSVTTGRGYPETPPAQSSTPVGMQNTEEAPEKTLVVKPPVQTPASTPNQPKANTPPAPPSTTPVSSGNRVVLPPLKDKGRYVVLTFDDGPSPYTAQLINTLDTNHVPSVFFWNTYHIQFANNEVKSLLANSPTINIGDHTVDHPNMNLLGYDAQYKEIVDAKNTIEKWVEKPVLFYRPPYGNYNAISEKVWEAAHLTPVLWNDDSLDWKYNSNKSAILNEIRKELQPGGVILMHDHPYTIQFLPDIIAMIRSQGYGFSTFATP
jgi:peptidoglycan/xylan/chitin deacetylase (PgdA/CDA1 family)